MGSTVRLRGATKNYSPGAAPALDHIDLAIAAGEWVAVVGPSGCGKSTLLHLVGAVDRPTGGSVEVDGRDLAELSESEITLFRRRRVGTVFQFFNLIPALTAFENVRLPLELDDAEGSHARARELLARVGLAGKAGSYPYELSGGQMQRVALA